MENLDSFWTSVKEKLNIIDSKNFKIIDIHDHNEGCFDLIVSNHDVKDDFTNIESWRFTVESRFLRKPKINLSIISGPEMNKFIDN